MAGIRQIKRRIKSASNIAQITKAMQMVAASKMRKAQSQAVSSKPYADKIYEAVAELSQITDSSLHKLLSVENKQGKNLIIFITTNKGLCGSLNTNLFRKFLIWFPEKQNYDVVTLGVKGAKFAVRNGYNLLADFSKETPFFKYVPTIIEQSISGFLEGKYKQVIVVFSSFINALNIAPSSRVILPMREIFSKNDPLDLPNEFVIEPSPVELLNALIPHYLETQVENAITQSEASEHSARMLAMKTATDNALSLSDELTLVYNKLRQEQITYEIADITRGQLSLTK